MLNWICIFLVLSLISGYFAFRKKTASSKSLFKIVFIVFMVLLTLCVALMLVQTFFHPTVDVKMSPSLPKIFP